jgi:hypothetical protein
MSYLRGTIDGSHPVYEWQSANRTIWRQDEPNGSWSLVARDVPEVGDEQRTVDDQCGLFAIYTPGHCMLPKGHKPSADHKSQYGVPFTRGLTKEEGGHE